ncbi:hypothetical protein ACHAXN_012876 [Cyclotella atomus]
MRSNSNHNSRERSGIYSRDIPSDRTDHTISHYQRRLGPLSNILLTDDPTNPDILQRRIRRHSSLLMVTSLFFWSWAMYNTFHLRKSNENALDLGIFSFAGTAVSSLFMLRMALGGTFFVCCKKRKSSGNNEDDGIYLEKGKKKTGDVDHSFPGGCLRLFTLMTQLIVMVNYLLGLLFAMTAGKKVYIYFATYCSIFSILWLVIAISSWNVLGAYRESVRSAFGDEFINKKSRSRHGVLACLLAYCYRRLTAGKQKAGGGENDDEMNEDEENDEIDDELKALYGSGKRYLNINY